MAVRVQVKNITKQLRMHLKRHPYGLAPNNEMHGCNETLLAESIGGGRSPANKIPPRAGYALPVTVIGPRSSILRPAQQWN